MSSASGRGDRPAPAERDITRTLPFWLMFGISMLGGVANSATAPTIPLYVDEVLGGGTELSGLLISLAAFASMIAMPLGGFLADRLGYRVIAVCGGCLSICGLILFAAIATVWGASAGRVMHGLGNAITMSLMMTWLVSLAPLPQRGRALSIFGLSVWVGLAVGPQVASAVQSVTGPRTVFVVCAVVEFALVLLVLRLPRPPRVEAQEDASADAHTAPGGASAVLGALRSVWPAGIAGAAAWCGEGLMLGFLIVHLVGYGVPATGVFGAASVFAVFAVSVIAARIVLAGMPDRIGPLRTAAISLITLCGGLAVLALAVNFPLAAIGAVLMGIGFAPLYPSLTMLAARGLRADNRALGLGIFGGFTSVGYASGALIGGLVLAALPSVWAFVLVAGLQLAALITLVVFSPDHSPRPHLNPDVAHPPTL